MIIRHRLLTGAMAAILASSVLFTAPQTAAQQNPHGIVAVVNDDIITTHDLRQRVLFMVATTGVERNEETLARIQQQAIKNLVDEHIQMQEAKKFDQTIDDDEVNQSMVQLIGRNGLDPDDVQTKLNSVGVSLETLQDQVRSEIAWQRIINGLYGSRIRISDAQIDETMTRISANASKPSFRAAEIYIEATPDIGGIDGAMEGARAMIAQVNEGAPFPLLAQQFSSSPTAAKGGDLGFVREGELRPEIDAALKTMEKGSISDPIQVPGGVYVIALLDKQISESETVYKLKQVNFIAETPDAMAEAKAKLLGLKDDLTDCATLGSDYKDIEGLNFADMGEVKASDMNDLILDALSTTDVGGLTDPIETPQGAVAVFVCDRRVTGSNVPTRDEVENRLIDQQLAQASKRHLRDLRRNSTIVAR